MNVRAHEREVAFRWFLIGIVVTNAVNYVLALWVRVGGQP